MKYYNLPRKPPVVIQDRWVEKTCGECGIKYITISRLQVRCNDCRKRGRFTREVKP